MRKKTFSQGSISDKLREMTAPYHNIRRAQNINPLFNLAYNFFGHESHLGPGKRTLQEIVEKVVLDTFCQNNSNYVRDEIKELNVSEAERYIQRTLTMEEYIPLLSLLLRKHMNPNEFSMTTKQNPFSSTECEILYDFMSDALGLTGKGRKTMKELSEERGWSEETTLYWMEFVLNKLRVNKEFSKSLQLLWHDAENGRIVTEEEVIFSAGKKRDLMKKYASPSYSKAFVRIKSRKKEPETNSEVLREKGESEIDRAFDIIDENPKTRKEQLKEKKADLLSRLKGYGITAPQISEELGIQRQTVYRYLRQTNIHVGDGKGIERALRDYGQHDSQRLKNLIQKYVFQPWIESLAERIREEAGETSLYRLLYDALGEIEMPEILAPAQTIFYEKTSTPIEDIERDIKGVFKDESKSATGLLKKHFSFAEFVVLNCQYGFISEIKNLEEIGKIIGGSTSQAFYYKKKGLLRIRETQQLREGLLELWKSQWSVPF